MQSMQDSSTYERYRKKLELLTDFDVEKVDELKLYLTRIHPMHWTVFGNRSEIPDSRWNEEYVTMLQELNVKTGKTKELILNELPDENMFYGNFPLSLKCPMFGIC